MEQFEKQIEVRWADVDQNGHVRHSAYYDYGAHVRIAFFNDAGFPNSRMSAMNIGPILFKEECSFLREIRPDDLIRVNLKKGSVNEDASRWSLHHELFNQAGKKVAHISIQGAWLDLEARKLAIPPADLATAMQGLPEGETFVYKKQ